MTGEFADDPGVSLRERKRDIARNGGHSQHFEFIRRSKGQQDGHRVVLARIGVDDDLAPRHCSFRKKA